jgi:hypothetical protein
MKPDFFKLKPFRECPLNLEISARFVHEQSALIGEWHVIGDVDQVYWPKPVAQAKRHHDLWKTTCFEAFFGETSQSPGYFELNVAPSGNWNFYTFEDYRKGAAEVQNIKVVSECVRFNDNYVLISCTMTPWMSTLHLRNLCAVIQWVETHHQSVHYFALQHNHNDVPDFHKKGGISAKKL